MRAARVLAGAVAVELGERHPHCPTPAVAGDRVGTGPARGIERGSDDLGVEIDGHRAVLKTKAPRGWPRRRNSRWQNDVRFAFGLSSDQEISHASQIISPAPRLASAFARSA